MSVEAIEGAAATAWPPIEKATLQTWTMSAGEGFSRRRNSAIPAGAAPTELGGHLRTVAAWYRDRGLPALYRITPACDPAIDAALAQRGFSFEAPTLVMSRPIVAGEPVAGVSEAPGATESWINAELEALGVDESLVGPWLRTIRSVPAPARFVTPVDGDRPVGAGLGVVVRELLGVFEIVVHSADRRRGHASRTMAALHRFGALEGATRVFLQVLEGDERSLALYRSLGYELSHRYWYRRAPG